MNGPSTSSGSNGSSEHKDKDSQWYFTSEQLASSPSRRHGIDADQELSYRQMTAYLIQEMGQRLQVSQLCINTAIVYMHRFYAFHSFTHFHRNGIAAASLFLAAKVEEQPRKLEHVIKAANKCLNQPTSSTTDTYYLEQAQDLVFNENVLLQTLGFDVAIDHPHTHVVKTCHLVKACKDLAQTSYFLASNSLHLTSMCLQYKPTVVACFCIYLACKWSRWEIPPSTEGKHWFHYVDKSVTMDLLKQLTDEFIAIYEKSPARLKSKLNSIKALAQGAGNRAVNKDKKAPQEEWKMGDMMKMYHSSINTTTESNNSNGGSISSSSSNSAQAVSYPMQTSTEQQQPSQQNALPALLPPPPPQTQTQVQQQQQQQLRKSEMHSSQHRSHHNSSSSHHHSKHPYGATSDVTDHKSGHKQQAAFGVNMVNRPRDHAQTSQTQSQHQVILPGSTGQPRANISSSSGRSSMVGSGGVGGSGNMAVPQNAQRQSTQGHQLDMNYHKSRERNSLLGIPATHSNSAHTSHKVPQKQQESGRVSSKSQDAMGRMPEQLKSSSNKMFPGMAGMNSKILSMEPAHDLSRSISHSQRAYAGQSQSQGQNQNQALVPPPPSYHQTQLSRQGGSSNNSNSSSNSKHEQPKPLSVHIQPPHHKQSVPATESNPYGAVTHESLGQHSSLHSVHGVPMGYNAMRHAELQHVEEHSTTTQYSNVHGMVPQTSTQMPQSQSKTASSIFNPDWNDKLSSQNQNQSQILGGNYNGNQMGAGLNEGYGLKLSNVNTKDSPRKVDREAPIKKEKNRTSHTHMSTDINNPMLAARASAQQQLKSSMPKKLDPLAPMAASVGLSSNLNELAGTSTSGAVSGGFTGKRASDLSGFKQEDDIHRDTKMRKLDNSVSSLSYTEAKGISDLNKLQVVNGIETNPDLVRSLLKESLCTTSGLLKPEPLPAPSHLPPAELLEPTSTATAYKSGTSDASSAEKSGMDLDNSMSGKAEKKKKKDKHKHKEKDKDKDKSKDREERKKHKKDKDRHKEREREREPDNGEHVKIKISKEKLEVGGSAGGGGGGGGVGVGSVGGEALPVGFKIKIPKDRIIGDLHGSGGGSGSGHVQSGAAPEHVSGGAQATPALKIKISKDKLENYSSGAAETMGVSQTLNNAVTAANYYASFGGHNVMQTVSHSSGGVGGGGSGGGVGGGSSKKKDRDRDKEREREKEKKRSSGHDFGKSNGSNSAGAAIGGLGGTVPAHLAANATLQKTAQNSSKMQHFSNNLSQLFGESNDDDDDDGVVGSGRGGATFRKYSRHTLPAALSSSLSTGMMSSAAAPSSQAYRQNTDFGMRSNEPPQHSSQHV